MPPTKLFKAIGQSDFEIVSSILDEDIGYLIWAIKKKGRQAGV